MATNYINSSKHRDSCLSVLEEYFINFPFINHFIQRPIFKHGNSGQKYFWGTPLTPNQELWLLD